MDDYQFSRGSEWRKWDLHAHTPLDSEWIGRPQLLTDSDRELFAQRYVATAHAAGLAVVAITDHNFCRSMDELLVPFIMRAATPIGLTVLPGFEVTVADCGGTHLLVIFSESSSLLTIDQVMTQLFPPEAPRFRGKEVLPSTRIATDLARILKESGLSHLVAFAHADRENGVLGQAPGAVRSRLWRQPFVRIAQLSKPPSECTGFMGTVVDGTSWEYSRDIAYMMASDCRGLSQSDLPPDRLALGERFTWIKADPTFEGLRQIVFEPTARTSFQEHRPEEKPPFRTIDQVRFLDPSGRFQSDPIPLNPNLVTIIGGKSTGKSILLSCIAQTVDAGEANKATEMAETNLYDLGDLDFEVRWTNGDVDRLSDSEVRHRVAFLPQMFIHRLVEHKNQPALSESLLGFLRQNEEFGVRYAELLCERDAVMSELATEISSFFAFLSSWSDVATRLKELGERHAVESELARVADRTEALRKASGFSDEETADYLRLRQEMIAAKAAHRAAHRVAISMREIAAGIPSVIQDGLDRIDTIVADSAASCGLEETEIQLVGNHVAKLKQTMETAKTAFADQAERAVAGFSGTSEEALGVVETTELALKPFEEKIANQKQLKENQEATKQLGSLLEAIRSCEKEKKQIERQYWSSVSAMKTLVADRFGVQGRLIELFNDPKYTHVGDDIAILAAMMFEKDRFESDFLGCFDLRRSVSWLGDRFRDNSISWSEEDHVRIIVDALDRLIQAPENERSLRAGQTFRNAVEILLRDYLSHSFTVKQGEEELLRMSPGKQGLVLLELFLHLSNSTYPVLIDQPEDNLDNRTIYSHLVDYIKRRKVHRQIIMVTHNPNLVLGADAEQVIVANQDGQGQGENASFRFEYVSGGIECSFRNPEAGSVLRAQGIREHVCHVLEGGEAAFRKREAKYCLA